MCPGFLAAEKDKTARHAKNAGGSAIRLGEWVDDQIFAFAGRGGWLPAVTFYAVREPRYQRASTCWSESVQRWRISRPPRYPSLEQWLLDAAKCDESARLSPEVGAQRECFKLVDSARLTEAVSRYIDWEAFAYWARPALEHEQSNVQEVARELNARCPGFARLRAKERTRRGEAANEWQGLMLWIGDHAFPDAKAEGWYDAIVISAGIHPRAIRTMEFADHCEEVWDGQLPVPYPSFEIWRRHADQYVDISSSDNL